MRVWVHATRAVCTRLYISFTVAAITAICCIFGLVGCGGKVEVSFVAPDGIEMYVGETRDIMPYIEFSRAVKNVEAAFSSSDESVVRVEGSTIDAIAQGNATVTVSTKYGNSQMEITVVYRDAITLDILCDGDTVQNADKASDAMPIVFSSLSDDFIDPQARVEWRVDGKAVSQDEEFVFTPTRFGEFEITAALQGLTATKSVKVYRTTAAYGRVSGKLEQTKNFSTVVFSAFEEIDTRNPKSVVVWTVNGVEVSNDKVFEFTPESQGRYEVELYVNGVKRDIEEENSAVVDVIGERAPNGYITFDADGVYVEWSDGAMARSVVITTPSGVRTAYSASDVAYSSRFGDGYFDATDLIDVTSTDPGDYTIAVTAVAQGETFTFTQYGEDAKPYIANKILIDNCFIDSAQRADAFVLELYVCGTNSATAYLARGVDGEAVVAAARARAIELGIPLSISVDGNILTVEFSEYVNAPTQSSEAVPEWRSMCSVLPHIEYNDGNKRSSSYALAVERIERTVDVSGTEQLLYAVLNGYKPAPVTGSAADIVFANARKTLLSIMGKDYTDEEKALAIFDWLQWTVFDTEGGRQYSCNYLENVFYVDSDSRPTFAVSSLGAAKTFALLCRMEGIEADIVPIEDNGTYYYINTVTLGGVKYVVDVYGSSYVLSASRELCTHERFLIDDKTAIALGLYDVSILGAFDGGQTYYLQKRSDGEVYYDNYIDVTETSDYDTIKAAVFDAFDRSDRSFSIFTVVGMTTIMRDTFGAEFFLDVGLDETAKNKVIENALRAVDEYAEERLDDNFRDGAVSVYTAGQTLHIIAIMPRTSE